MRIYLFVLFFLSFAPVSFGADAAPKDVSELVDLCVKNAARPKDAQPDNRQVCECSIKGTLTFIDGNTEAASKAKQTQWLKRFYSKKLSQKEIDDDAYSLLEFNFPITEKCLKEKAPAKKPTKIPAKNK